MKKFLLTILILLFTANLSYAEYVNANLLNVRSEPNTNSKIVKQLNTNQNVKILDTKEDWVFIEWRTLHDRVYGWVASKYLSEKPIQMTKEYQPKRVTQNYYSPVDSFEMITGKFKCKESYIDGTFDSCKLDVNIYYSGIEDNKMHSATCIAYLDYLSISETGYKTKSTGRMFFAGFIYKNLPLGNQVTLTYDFKVYENVVRASVKEVMCELLY